ncbi:MAG: hypothetical protein KI791_07190 [Cyclobacteriaceae bacterium]|nr:hypothetical protein [Cyclobacteriaceae bacterium SS2]
MNSKAIILIQALDDVQQYDFDYPLEKQLKALKNTTVLTLDSQSDRSITASVKKLLEENDQKILILDTRLSTKLGIGQVILNAFIQTKDLGLICLGDAKGAGPFLKLFDGKVFESEAEVVAYLSSN